VLNSCSHCLCRSKPPATFKPTRAFLLLPQTARRHSSLAALKNLCRGTIDAGSGRSCERAFVGKRSNPYLHHRQIEPCDLPSIAKTIPGNQSTTVLLPLLCQLSYSPLAELVGFEPTTYGLSEGTLVFTTGKALTSVMYSSATPQAEGAAVFLPEAPRVGRRDFHAHFNSSVGEPLTGALLVHRNALRVAGFDHRGCASAAIRAVPAGFLARTPHLRLALVGSISRLHHRLKKCSLPGE
jgi:hypothetical protein